MGEGVREGGGEREREGGRGRGREEDGESEGDKHTVLDCMLIPSNMKPSTLGSHLLIPQVGADSGLARQGVRGADQAGT